MKELTHFVEKPQFFKLCFPEIYQSFFFLFNHFCEDKHNAIFIKNVYCFFQNFKNFITGFILHFIQICKDSVMFLINYFLWWKNQCIIFYTWTQKVISGLNFTQNSQCLWLSWTLALTYVFRPPLKQGSYFGLGFSDTRTKQEHLYKKNFYWKVCLL